MNTAQVEVGGYYRVDNLIGFSKHGDRTSLRCKVLRVAGPYDVIVITADIRDAGTKLAVDTNQLKEALY
jgi:hypothetical protein